jgi:O-antigen ligase
MSHTETLSPAGATTERTDSGRGAYVPSFSAVPLLVVIACRPFADAAYAFPSSKYAYMVALLAGAVFFYVGRAMNPGTSRATAEARPSMTLLWTLAAYSLFLTTHALIAGDPLSEVLKILSPFILFAVAFAAADRGMYAAMVIASAATIVGNLALLPFDYGWTYWGSVKTFRGFFYFKTDIAYAVTFALLICSSYLRFRPTALLISLIFACAALVVLSNSRLNYLGFAVVTLFILYWGGVGIVSLVRTVALAAIVGAVGFALYDPQRMLGFDMSSQNAFTQGRSYIWEQIVDALMQGGARTWLFGAGLFADVRLSEKSFVIGAESYNAHNEYLHLLYTQGVLGLTTYVFLWITMIRSCTKSPLVRPWMSFVCVAGSVFLLQGMTAVLSSFATKTWPFVWILLAVRTLAVRSPPVGHADTA